MSRDNQDYMTGYMDGVKVKISEMYKPPPKVNLPMSYSQRLTLNKQIQDSLPDYDNTFEKTVKDKMKEWRTARTVMKNELNERLEKAKEDEVKRQEEKIELQKKLDDERVEVKSMNESSSIFPSGPSFNMSDANPTFSSIPSQNYTFSSNSPLLMPTQASSNYSNILTPIPLTNSTSQHCTPADKSPFNISDFEADTSSPFDNMELKSINDMEELAQVLKRESPLNRDTKQTLPASFSNVQTNNRTNYMNYPAVGADYHYNRNSVHYMQPTTSYHPQSHINGYYHPDIQANQVFSSSFHSTKAETTKYTSPQMQNSYGQDSKAYRSVPDIMKTLQTGLDNTRLTTNAPGHNSEDRPRAHNAIYLKSKTKTDEELLHSLPKDLQDLSRTVSSMGFPLARVARVCKAIGNDHKKVVEHLLAMSDLLDLGFSEVSVTEALLRCDNDRDKALDVLIS